MKGRRRILAQWNNNYPQPVSIFEERRRILAQYGNGIIKLSTGRKYFEGRRKILAQYGNGII